MKEKPADQQEKKYQKPIRYFERRGTVSPEKSYYVEIDRVVNSEKQDIKTVVDMGRYFSIFASRQSGKTTFLERLRDKLHKDPTYVMILLDFQEYNDLELSQFYTLLEKSLYEQLIDRLQNVQCEKTGAVQEFLLSHSLTDHISFHMLFERLNQILQYKKIIVFIDEFDGIPMSALSGFLTSLRGLYLKYKHTDQKALYSVGLIGIRNITKLMVGGVSPFNIADHIEIPPFSFQNIHDLYAQYTDETNQPFTENAVNKIYEETAGQPWLVNRLGAILTVQVKPETVTPIDEKDVENAIQLLLKENNDHFDNLYEKAKLYKETFIEIVFDHVEYYPDDEDQSWLKQYGLIKEIDNKAVVANAIYKARYVKTFFREARATKIFAPEDYSLPNRHLDMESLLQNFSQYISQIGVKAFYEKGKPYEKTGQFLLTAWLFQLVTGSEGSLQYEVNTGLGRMDILISYKGIKYIIETKVNHLDDISIIRTDGVRQLARKYLATEMVAEGFLVIFDTHTQTGASCKPSYLYEGNKKVTSFTIGIGRNELKKSPRIKKDKTPSPPMNR